MQLGMQPKLSSQAVLAQDNIVVHFGLAIENIQVPGIEPETFSV